MFQKKDESHLNAMNKVQKLMRDPNAMKKWLEKIVTKL
jgi:hypothetical protein